MSSIFSSISGLGHFVVALFCLAAFVTLYSSWKKAKNEMVKSFMFMFVSVAVFMFVMGTMDYLLVLNEELILKSPSVPGIMFAIAHVFMILAIAFYSRIPFEILFAKVKNIGFWLAFGTGLLPIAAAFAMPISPTVEAGITHYNVSALSSALIGVWALIFIAGFGGVFFLYQAFKMKEHFIRIRSVILGVGFLIWVVGGPLHDFATTAALYLFADLLLLSSFVVILIGIYIKKLTGFVE